MITVLVLKGKASDVFPVLKELSDRYGNMPVKQLALELRKN